MDAGAIPEAWPLLLTREQLCAYLGISADTLAKVCPIQPVELGANVVRYVRPQIDAWIGGLPPRLRQAQEKGQDPSPPAAPVVPIELAQTERRMTAVERARARAEASTAGGEGRWKRSRTSNG